MTQTVKSFEEYKVLYQVFDLGQNAIYLKKYKELESENNYYSFGINRKSIVNKNK